jgi:hypothetical protein
MGMQGQGDAKQEKGQGKIPFSRNSESSGEIDSSSHGPISFTES